MRLGIGVCVALTTATAAHAHHGFGSFDMEAEIEITGTVTDLAFVNPHSWLYMDVEQADGDTIAMRCEMRSATTLRRSGWSPDMFPVGESVHIVGSPDSNDPAACYVSTVVFADGSTIDRYGQRTPPVEATNTPRAERLANGDPNIAGDWGAEQLVMSDPRGVQGSLVPLSQAPGAAQELGNADSDGSRRGTAPLIAGDTANRLYFGNVPMTEAGQAAAAAARGANSAMRCQPIGIVMDWTYDAPVNRITQTADTVTLEYGKFDYTRTIHLDQTSHPANLEPSLTGHSIGRWDNDVLVVDTIGVRAGSLTRSLIHSDAMHLVERFSLDTDSMILTREFSVEDPLFYLEPYSGSDQVSPSNVPYLPSPCDDRSLF